MISSIGNRSQDRATFRQTNRPYVHCWTDQEASERVTPMPLVVRGAVAAQLVTEDEAQSWLDRVEAAGRAEDGVFLPLKPLMLQIQWQYLNNYNM